MTSESSATRSAKRRVGYVRVSTASGEQLAALENQRARIAATGVDYILEDVQSGRATDRDGYQQLLELIATGSVTEVVITRVDRLGRDAADTDAAIAFAARKGVAITALDGGHIESITPTGFVMSRIMTTMAEMESRMLSQRIKAGLSERRKRRMPCRGRAPWGYQLNSDRTALEPHPLEWPRAEQFLRILAANNWRMNTALDEWARLSLGPIPLNSCRAVKAWLKNPILRGGLGYGQQSNHVFTEIAWDTHPALIQHSEFTAIERHLEANRRMWGRHSTREQRLLTSLCRCGSCGKAMSYAGSRTIPAVMCRTRGCEQQYKSTHESVIAGAIAYTLAAHAEALASNAPTLDNPEVEQLKASIASLESLADTDLAEAIELKRARLASLLQKPQLPPENLDALRDPRLYERASYEQLTQLYHRFVEQVVVTRQEVERVVLRF